MHQLPYTKLLLLVLLLLLILLTPTPSYAQTVIKGVAVNNRSEAIPYVNIGVKKKYIGAAADHKGNFTLCMRAEH